MLVKDLLNDLEKGDRRIEMLEKIKKPEVPNYELNQVLADNLRQQVVFSNLQNIQNQSGFISGSIGGLR